MFRFIIPTTILVISVLIFFVVTKPAYSQISALKAKSAAYEIALGNAKELQAVRDELSAKYNAFSPEDIARLKTLLPDTVDSVQLVIDLDDVAQSHGMVFKDTAFDAQDATDQKTPSDLLLAAKEYRASKLTFTVEGTYENFTAFLKDLERSLRLVEIQSLDFSAASVAGSTNSFSFKVDLVTYWLRND